MLNYQRAKENRARRDFLRERCYLWGIILRGLGERLNGIQEASGSIPLISTKNPDCLRNRDFYFLPLHYYSISKCLESGRASVFLGIVSFRTPFSYFALISSAFTPDKSKSRLYEP